VVWANYTNHDGSGDGAHPSPNPNILTAPEGYEIILYVSTVLEIIEYNTKTNYIDDLLQILINSGNIGGRAYGGLWYIGPDSGPDGSWPVQGTYTWGAYARIVI